jgi:peptidylprolyl isomerase
MFRQMILLAFLSLFSVASLFSEPDRQVGQFLNQEMDELSFYVGYLMGCDYLKNTYGFRYNFNQVIAGMQAAIQGDPISQKKEELIPLIKKMQQAIVENQARLNLKEAEGYLRLIAGESDVRTVEPLKLFYKIQTQGSGLEVDAAHPWLHFKVYELRDQELFLRYSTSDDFEKPIQIETDEMVDGFAKGIQKMKIGEERRIYVHPDLAFGMGKQDIAPNRLIIFDVKAQAQP